MTKQLYTKGHWNIATRGHRNGLCDIDSYHGYTVVTNISINNAKRIVACVNLCEGIDTETLETSPDLASAFISAENARLMQVNAELLLALKRISRKSDVDYFNLKELLEVIGNDADAAIAKGEAA